jgi:Acetyltransferases, including N-acetylases of ribosomal proteins
MRLTDGVVVLREWREEDIEPALALTKDPEILRYTRVPEDNTAEIIRGFMFEHPDAEARLVIADPETDAMLGSAAVLRADVEAGRAELGYWIGAEHRGRGFAARAVDLLADWALREQGFVRLELHIDPENVASLRVAEKTGFVLEGVLRSYEELKGRRVDVAMYARLAG